MRTGTVVAIACVLVVGCASESAASAAGRAGHVCRVPRLVGRTLQAARERVEHVGCSLVVKGAKLERPEVQTVRRQSPSKGKHDSRVTVWLNPACFSSAEVPPVIDEPLLTPGPTELVVGFYLGGGPLLAFSTSGCKRPEQPSGGGTVEVVDPTTGAIIATQTAAYGHLAEIPLPPGTYKAVGTFARATINEQHAKETMTVEIPTGRTVRQDFELSIP